jgi:hypothetical protein
MVAREQARAATIMFLRCFFVFLFFYFYGRARASARSDYYVFALFFRIPFLWSRASKRAQRPLCFCAVFSYSFFFIFIFFIFIFFIFFVCRQLIMSKASAYGDEIWQVDSLPQNADRMFISLKSLKGFARGRGEGPQNSIGGSVSITGE